MIAMYAEITMKNTMNTRMMETFFFSPILFLERGSITSSVNVELDVSTREESVDMEAESTSTMTTAMTSAGRVASIAGTIVSNRGVTPFFWYMILSA